MASSERYSRGLEVLKQVGGPTFDVPLKSLDDIAPDLSRFIVEFAYGDVMARPNLGLKERQLCTVTALAAMNNAPAQLRYHIDGALNVGWRPEELVELMILETVYAGFPAAVNGILATREVLAKRGIEPGVLERAAGDRRDRGVHTLEKVNGSAGEAVIDRLNDIAPDLGRFIVENSYGDVTARPDLDLKTKELVTVALLTALGTAQPQLEVHVHAAFNAGNSREEIVEAIQQMAVYAGFPAALDGLGVARKVIAERGANP